MAENTFKAEPGNSDNLKGPPKQNNKHSTLAATIGVGAAVGLLLTTGKRFLREGIGEEVRLTLDDAFLSDTYIHNQAQKEIDEVLPDGNINYSTFDTAVNVSKHISETDNTLAAMGLKYSKEDSLRGFAEIAPLCMFPKYSSESVSVISGGHYKFPHQSISDMVLTNSIAKDESEGAAIMQGVVLAKTSSGLVILNNPFQGGFIISSWQSEVKTVTKDGTFVVVAGIAGVDEKFANREPRATNVGIHGFGPKGDFHIPICTAKNYNNQETGSIGLGDGSLLFAVYDHLNKTVILADVNLDEGFTHKVSFIDLNKIREVFKDKAVLPERVSSLRMNDGSVTYFWEVLTVAGTREKHEVVEQNIALDGTETFTSFQKKYNEIEGVNYRILGNIGDTAVILESNSNLLFGLVFIDKDGHKNRKKINIPVPETILQQITLNTESVQYGLLEICMRSAEDPNTIKVIGDLLVQKSDELFSKISPN